MTGSPAPPSRRGRGIPAGPGGRSDGWAAFSYLLSGMIVYGGIGWVLGHWVIHSALVFPLGMVLGLALATVLVVFRFGRS